MEPAELVQGHPRGTSRYFFARLSIQDSEVWVVEELNLSSELLRLELGGLGDRRRPVANRLRAGAPRLLHWEPMEGFEPPTRSLRKSCSTPEPHRQRVRNIATAGAGSQTDRGCTL